MDPHSEITDLIAGIQESARRGDWENAGKLAGILQQQTPPVGREELGEYLNRLKHALIFAKASRFVSMQPQSSTMRGGTLPPGAMNLAKRQIFDSIKPIKRTKSYILMCLALASALH
jgi:hypothetical protein